MSIRRISELPNMETFLRERGYIAGLSDCMFEVSFTPDNGTTYHSLYMTGRKFADFIVEEIAKKEISGLIISGDIIVKDGRFKLDNSILELSNGSSIIAWPNINSGVETSCYLHFDDIRLSSENDILIHSDGKLNLDGDPVIINNNLCVYTNKTVTNNTVEFSNAGNTIFAEKVSLDQLGNNPNKVVTCGMLNSVYTDFLAKVNQYDRGSGVDYSPTPEPKKYKLTVSKNPPTEGIVAVYVNGDLKEPPYSDLDLTDKIKIEATATGKPFEYWSGTTFGIQSVKDNPIEFMMGASDRSISANFTGAEIIKITVTADCNKTTGKPKFTTNPTTALVSPKPYSPKKSGELQTYTFTNEGYQSVTKTYTLTQTKTTGSEQRSTGPFNMEDGSYSTFFDYLRLSESQGKVVKGSIEMIPPFLKWKIPVTVTQWSIQ